MMKKWRATLYTSLMGSLLGVVLLVTSPAYAQCPDGITSLWALDELNGPNYSDSVGVNDGVGAPNPTAVAGIVDGAQQFNGVGTGINVPADDSFNWAFDDSFSIEYWMRRTDDAFSSNEIAVGRDDGATSDMQWWTGLWMDGTAAFVLIATDGTGNGSRVDGEFLEGNDVLTDGEWHHVAVVRDFTTNENRLYVDGVLNDSVIINYVDGEGFDSDSDLNMGYINLDGGFNYNGTLDEVAIYSRVLTADEIFQHFNDESSVCPPDPDDDDDKDKKGGGGGGGSSCFIESLR